MLVLPIVAYGYTGHVMDFPGTINNDFEHFMHHVLDITKSLAYHGFKKIILLNGHGSNMPNLDLVARRTNLETDAECLVRGLVEPADGRQGVFAALAAEQVSRRLCARLRAGDVALPVSRRRQRAQRQDQERHDQLQRGKQPVQLGRPVRRRPGHGDLLDQQLFRDRRAGRAGAGHAPKRAARSTRKPSSNWCASSPGSRTARATCAATAIAARRPCRCPGASGPCDAAAEAEREHIDREWDLESADSACVPGIVPCLPALAVCDRAVALRAMPMRWPASRAAADRRRVLREGDPPAA